MTSAELLAEVNKVFPHVEKPKGLELSFHKDACFLCEYLRRDLQEFSGRELPARGLRLIYNEMSCLSAAGWRWALPSYLRHSLTASATYDDCETEFLIYNLGPKPEHQEETIQRLAHLDDEQIACLIHFLEWCANHPHWSDYCADSIASAQSFMRLLRPAPS